MKGQAKDMFYGASHLLFKKAEELRKSSTWEEEIIWNYLSGNNLGVKFRRQHPILFYIADFYCHQLKLIIEIDGSIHKDANIKINDKLRQKEIEEIGVTMVRFTNTQVKTIPKLFWKRSTKK